jgi:hypothetical protein
MSAVAITDIIGVLKVLSGYDFQGAIAAFEGQDDEVKIDEALLTLEDAAKIAGLFVPEAATAAEWIEVVRIALPILATANKELPGPHVLRPGEYEAFGHVFNGTLIQGTFTS